MKIKLVLIMENVTLCDKRVDQIIIEWEEISDPSKVLDLSKRWINEKNFITKRMLEVTYVGASSLTIEPLEEEY